MGKVLYRLRERVDANNSPVVLKEMDDLTGDGSVDIIIDFASNKYISSSGLRAILYIQKKVAKAGGSQTLVNVSQAVKEIFDVTGYSRFLSIE